MQLILNSLCSGSGDRGEVLKNSSHIFKCLFYDCRQRDRQNFEDHPVGRITRLPIRYYGLVFGITNHHMALLVFCTCLYLQHRTTAVAQETNIFIIPTPSLVHPQATVQQAAETSL